MAIRMNDRYLQMDLKCEGTIHKHAAAALRCYQRALKLDDTNPKLWIEYGSFAYQLHSYAARQLKQVGRQFSQLVY